MKVLDITEVKLEYLDFSKLHRHQERDYELLPGHVGAAAIVRHVARGIGKYTKDHEKEETAPWRMLLGMGFEVQAARLYPGMIYNPRVLGLSNIMGHLDGWHLDEIENRWRKVVDEFKLTAMSLRVKGTKPPDIKLKDIKQEWTWHSQVMVYCKLLSSVLHEPVNHGLLHVMWAMGTYETGTMDERYLKYLVEYEQREIDANWNLLVAHRDEVGK